MRRAAFLAFSGLLLVGGFARIAQPVVDSRATADVVFVCRNGVAMSVWSAAYFNRLAAAHGLRERAVARAAIPSFTDVPLRMRFALALDGFRLDGYRPHVVSDNDARDADLVVAIDTELPSELSSSSPTTESWQGFPPMREQYFPSRKVLKAKVEALVQRLQP